MVQLKNRTSYEGQLVALEEVLRTLREQDNVETLIERTLRYLKSDFGWLV